MNPDELNEHITPIIKKCLEDGGYKDEFYGKMLEIAINDDLISVSYYSIVETHRDIKEQIVDDLNEDYFPVEKHIQDAKTYEGLDKVLRPIIKGFFKK